MKRLIVLTMVVALTGCAGMQQKFQSASQEHLKVQQDAIQSIKAEQANLAKTELVAGTMDIETYSVYRTFSKFKDNIEEVSKYGCKAIRRNLDLCVYDNGLSRTICYTPRSKFAKEEGPLCIRESFVLPN